MTLVAYGQTPQQVFNLLNQTAAGGGYDPDAQAYFDRVATAGGSLTTPEMDAWNTFVLSAKANSYYSKFKAFHCFILGSTDIEHGQNAISSSYTYTWNNSPTQANTGVTFNGSSQWANTNFNPSTDFSTNSASIGVWSSSASTANVNQIDFGCDNSTSFYLGIKYRDLSNNQIGNWAGTFAMSASSTASVTGLFVTTSDASTVKTYAGNTETASASGGSGSRPNQNLGLGAWNKNSGLSDYSDKTFQMAFIGTSLSATDVININTDFQALKTTLGR
jgi:hypothetical protein